jgi:hypothetical protein
VLVAGPGAGRELAPRTAAIAKWIERGGRVLAIKIDSTEASLFLPTELATRSAEHIAAWFPAFGAQSPFAGISPADVHNRDPRQLPLVTGGATTFGNGVLAEAEHIVFCQFAPWDFDPSPERFNLRRTFVRTSVAASRLLGNLGVSGSTPLLERFDQPALASSSVKPEGGRCLQGLYLTHPTEWDDPYRFFRW